MQNRGEHQFGVDKVAGTLPRKPGIRLAASMSTFTLATASSLCRKFGDPHDAPAQALMAKVFPGRRVVAVPEGRYYSVVATFIASPGKSPRVRRCPDLALDREGNSQRNSTSVRHFRIRRVAVIGAGEMRWLGGGPAETLPDHMPKQFVGSPAHEGISKMWTD